jgi:tetratricopeptide (TPR) repeat protein
MRQWPFRVSKELGSFMKFVFARQVGIAVVIAFMAATATAQESAPDPSGGNDVAAARQHFTKGNRLFDLQKYGEAAKEYESAYEAKDDPALLFNIGQAYRLAGDYQRAIGAYKAYLRRSPKPRNRQELEARLVDLQKLVAEQRRTHEAPPNGNEPGPEPHEAERTVEQQQPAPAPQPPQQQQAKPAPPIATTTGGSERTVDASVGRTKRLAGIGLVAGGGACIVVGATLTGLAYAIQSQQSHPGAGVAYDPSAASRMRAEQGAGAAMLGVGAAAAVGGTVLYLLGRKEAAHARVAAAPLVGSGTTGVMLTGVFQ